jgi:hypothetical protein
MVSAMMTLAKVRRLSADIVGELMAPVQGVYDAFYNVTPAPLRAYLPDKAPPQKTALGSFVRGGSRVAAGAVPVYKGLQALGLGGNVVTALVSAKAGNRLTRARGSARPVPDKERLEARLESLKGFLDTAEDRKQGDKTLSLDYLINDPGLVEKLINVGLSFPEDMVTEINPEGVPVPPEVRARLDRVLGPELSWRIRGYMFNDWDEGQKLETPWWSPIDLGAKDREIVDRQVARAVMRYRKIEPPPPPPPLAPLTKGAR